MSKLRILSIGLALLALSILLLDWLGIIGRVDRLLIIFPLLLLGIVFKHTDIFLKKRNKIDPNTFN